MKMKDILGLGLITAAAFPILMIIMLLSQGVIRFDVGLDEEAKEKTNAYLRKYHPQQDEAEIKHMKTYESMRLKEKELERTMAEVQREQERLENLKIENNKLKDDITKERKKIESLIADSREIQQKRLRALAEVYGSMRPEEAAPILLTLKDKLVADILLLIPEVRSQSKLMGALGTIDVKRAARISKLMGKGPSS